MSVSAESRATNLSTVSLPLEFTTSLTLNKNMLMLEPDRLRADRVAVAHKPVARF